MARKRSHGKVIRTNPQLWEKSKREAVKKMGGKHSARAMQLAVQIYKRAGGRYVGRKPGSTSLGKWGREDWGYVDGRPGNRYLPRRVRERLTPEEKARTNRAKRAATRMGKQWSRQPRDIARKASRIRRAIR